MDLQDGQDKESGDSPFILSRGLDRGHYSNQICPVPSNGVREKILEFWDSFCLGRTFYLWLNDPERHRLTVTAGAAAG